MSERRLTDEELRRVIDQAEKGHVETALLYARTSLGQSMSESLLGIVTEIKARRTADLTDADREALADLAVWVNNQIAETQGEGVPRRTFQALAVLDRLIGGTRG